MRASALLVALSTAASVSANSLRYRAAVDRPAAVIEKRAEVTDAWVTVDDEAQPATTYTPSYTVVDGTTSVVDGAPHDLTATVYTTTQYGKVSTSTGEPPNPTATKSSGEGAFPRCHNLDGEHAPFCYPVSNSTLYVDKTYYVTWDPDYFNTSSSSNVSSYDVSVRIDYFNETSWSLIKEAHLEKTNASWGFFPMKIESSYLHKYKKHNFTLSLYKSPKDSTYKENVTSIWVQFSKTSFPKNEGTTVPKGKTLTIALPVVFGSIILLLIGGFLWNRKTRAISLGNIMSRRRHGYTGRKTRRFFRKDNGIQLDNNVAAGEEYHDIPADNRRQTLNPEDPTFYIQRSGGANVIGPNMFRDEIARQDRERN